ncbi:hypothetical protein [Chryseolinea lacunae]|uniref:Glycosyltransferase family 1 protein n=1 Tax=Chryseolinea lacunae TaxID=2801331 RepID=A0ABS1KVV4_9BACT|nr:hypothetical protein [Chryseolinea lacunae]MBL0742446.1 hypothetical protein [Chryseolinea lacunae]
MGKGRSTVALLDHHAEGHHHAFIKLFTKYLLRAGYDVCIFFPVNKELILSELSADGVDVSRVQFFTFTLTRQTHTRLGRFNEAASVLQLWIDTRRALKAAEQKLKLKFDRVFLAWLDDYLANYLPPQAVDAVFPYSWSGLYFHPWYLFQDGLKNRATVSSIDSVLRARKCLSVAVHDEFLLPKLAERIQKRVIFFPEIADATPPRQDEPTAQEIRTRANGRIVVGLIGLAKRKGTLHLLALATHADPSQFFFFFAGKLPEADYTTEEYTKAKSFFDNPPKNCFHYPNSIAEGETINAVINALDILFLVYDNFKSSSNFNTKAAHFRKPVLATKRFWIGKVTEKFLMGETVEEGNLSQTLTALNTLRDRIKTNTLDFSRYDEYLSLHKEENLTESFTKAFAAHASA